MVINQTLINWKNVQNYLSNLKRKSDISDVDELVPAAIDFSKLIDVVKMILLKRCMYC